MFTAEELEECDIFPKKVTWQIAVKISIYAVLMTTASILMYSFYSGRDFTSIITMEGLKYGSDSYFIERIWKLDNKFNYNISDKYSMNLTLLGTDPYVFIKDYVSISLPLIIRSLGNSKMFEKIKNEGEFLKNYVKDDKNQFMVEERVDPNAVFFKKGFSKYNMSYDKFLEKAKDKSRMVNYILNEIYDETLAEDLQMQLEKNFTFVKNLELNTQGVKYTEGFDEMVNPGHSEARENIICQIESDIDLMLISPLQRNCVYPYKKDYGPPNYSAVNFFKPEYGRFPNFRDAHRLYITLSKGDCLYIPSHWWFSYKTQENQHFVNIKFEFESHSRWSDEIISGLEKDQF